MKPARQSATTLGTNFNPKHSTAMELRGSVLLLCSLISPRHDFGISELAEWLTGPFGLLCSFGWLRCCRSSAFSGSWGILLFLPGRGLYLRETEGLSPRGFWRLVIAAASLSGDRLQAKAVCSIKDFWSAVKLLSWVSSFRILLTDPLLSSAARELPRFREESLWRS